MTVAANATGGVSGKMISPQSIAIGAASVGLVGKESELFRFTVKHSLIMLTTVCLITLAQAYLLKWMIPEYQMTDIKTTTIKYECIIGVYFPDNFNRNINFLYIYFNILKYFLLFLPLYI